MLLLVVTVFIYLYICEQTQHWKCDYMPTKQFTLPA